MSRRWQRRHVSWFGLVIAILLLVAGQYGWPGKAKQEATVSEPGLYAINHYIDGDTIAINMNGQVESVRFIGIDTPETHKPNTPVQCYGAAAAAHTKTMIERAGGKVRLVADKLSTNRDRYDRLLRYVYLPDGTNLNLLNIQQGYAFYYPYFPFSKSAEFAAAEQQAIAKHLGLWGNCHPTPSDNGGYKMDETQAEANAP